MLEVGGGLDLSQESFGTYYSGEFRFQNLERNLALLLQVVSQIDRRHPALTDLTLDAVAALEGCVQVGDGVGSVHSA